MSAPVVSLVLTVPLPTSEGRADLRRASLTEVPAGAAVRVEGGDARFFDPTHVGLFAASLSPAGSVQFNASDGAFLVELRSAVLRAWGVGR